MPTARDQFFTLKEISRARRIGIRALDRAVKAGELTTYKWDGWRRVRSDDLERWLARHRSGGAR